MREREIMRLLMVRESKADVDYEHYTILLEGSKELINSMDLIYINTTNYLPLGHVLGACQVVSKRHESCRERNSLPVRRSKLWLSAVCSSAECLEDNLATRNFLISQFMLENVRCFLHQSRLLSERENVESFNQSVCLNIISDWNDFRPEPDRFVMLTILMMMMMTKLSLVLQLSC